MSCQEVLPCSTGTCSSAPTTVASFERNSKSRRRGRERNANIFLSDTGLWTNHNLFHARAGGDILGIAEAVIEASVARRESRGSHYRADFPTRNDDDFLKSTVANDSTPQNSRSLGSVEALIGPTARSIWRAWVL